MWIPLLTSLIVALGGLLIGWAVYRNVTSPEQDFLQIPVLKNKWYVDEIYNVLFVKPAIWFAETFVSQWMDKGVIDGILHTLWQGHGGHWLNAPQRTLTSLSSIRFFGDGTSRVIKWFGRSLRPTQSGRVQQYMVLSLIILLALVGLVYYFLMRVG